MKKIIIILSLAIITLNNVYANRILIPMDLSQTDHLKAYGICFWLLNNGSVADWLLNYRGGSFMMDYTDKTATECRIRGVFFENVSESKAISILEEVQTPNVNMDVVKLEKAPKICVYATPGAQPWDDAVRLVLEYAEVKHDVIWDEEVLTNKLKDYDWLHLHHEDFTGQHGKFWANFKTVPWYIQQVALNDAMARKLGFAKVSEMKKDVAIKIREFVATGGYLFAMCSATDTYDIALASLGIDCAEEMFDGDPADAASNRKLKFDETFAFENFHIFTDPYEHEFSDIDVTPEGGIGNPATDYFTLFDFSAKYDPVPTMLTQCHVNVLNGFLGQTTAFHKKFVKKNVILLGQKEGTDEIKYIHGNVGKGFFTWYGGHDPEDYRHNIGDPQTDLNLHKTSPGYRLILNNILFPAAKKKKQKT